MDFRPKKVRGEMYVFVSEKVQESMCWFAAHNFARFSRTLNWRKISSDVLSNIQTSFP